MKQHQNGKAFEYILAVAFSRTTNALIEENKTFKIAESCYFNLLEPHKRLLNKAAQEAALFLKTHDKRIAKSSNIILQKDGLGIKGDVRDIIINTCDGKQVGVSAKHNHTALKHSRLSNTIDFGKEWTGYSCSSTYFKEISPVFEYLRELRTKKMLFREINNKEDKIYLPILITFEDELKRLCEKFEGIFVEKLFRYLLGKYDFYKIILNNNHKNKSVTIQSINIGGTLEYGTKWKIPNKISNIYRKSQSSNTLIVIFEEGWTLSFRIHNASSKVEASLKFDIQFIGISSKATTHQIELSH